MSYVLDGSIAVTWCFPDERTPDTDALLADLKSGEAFVPAIWPTEIANALLTAIRRSRISSDVAYRFLRELNSMPIRIQSPASSFSPLLSSAITHGLTVYDATYVDLAFQLGIPLATKDSAMRAAATKLGVPLLP